MTTLVKRLARARLLSAQARVSLRLAAIRTPASTNRAGIAQLGVHLRENIFRDRAVLGLPIGDCLVGFSEELFELLGRHVLGRVAPLPFGVRYGVLRHCHGSRLPAKRSPLHSRPASRSTAAAPATRCPTRSWRGSSTTTP